MWENRVQIENRVQKKSNVTTANVPAKGVKKFVRKYLNCPALRTSFAWIFANLCKTVKDNAVRETAKRNECKFCSASKRCRSHPQEPTKSRNGFKNVLYIKQSTL